MSVPRSAPYPLDALQAVALHTQGLEGPHHDGILDVVRQVGCVQIDTLHRVQRSQYLVIWSRLGQYDPAEFDRLMFGDGERRLFEYWRHAASIIPLDYYRYSIPAMQHHREGASQGWQEWLADAENQRMLSHVRERIEQEGPLRVADFKYDGPKRGTWWDWKPAKIALEHLYNTGDAMIANRVNFHRVYDLRERVLPDWVDTTPPTREEAMRFHVEQGLRALGVCRPDHTASYAFTYPTVVRPHVAALVEEGTAIEVHGELASGEEGALVIHRDNLPLLEQAADGGLPVERTTFLSPFDSLFWAAGRDEAFWGFQQRLEAYKRAEDRIWGYFSLAILRRGRLIGRFDPKLERKIGTLRLEHLHLEPGVEPEEALVADVAGAMRDFMAFHSATELVVEHSNPPEFGDKLLAAL
ncbi:MAG TPA: crosslink repair DNA glycosylase YcaQ family protein [Aggregatilineales bacterium]|nr:crosslink repair DNA glycosylase YcaQ family protein [Aggregatilineales bacterium]